MVRARKRCAWCLILLSTSKHQASAQGRSSYTPARPPATHYRTRRVLGCLPLSTTAPNPATSLGLAPGRHSQILAVAPWRASATAIGRHALTQHPDSPRGRSGPGNDASILPDDINPPLFQLFLRSTAQVATSPHMRKSADFATHHQLQPNAPMTTIINIKSAYCILQSSNQICEALRSSMGISLSAAQK